MQAKGEAVDRRRIEVQIRAVLLTLRGERRRRRLDTSTMQELRGRARAILDGMAREVGPYPDLESQLQEAFEELDGDNRSKVYARSPEEAASG